MKRQYRVSDVKLSHKIKMFLIYLQQDLTLLEEYGITQAKIDALALLRATFGETIGMDSPKVGTGMLAKGEEKDKAREVFLMLEKLKIKVEDKWRGADADEKLTEFALKGSLSKLNPLQLYERALLTKEALIKYATDLGADYQIDPAYVTYFGQQLVDLKALINAASETKVTRKVSTIGRVSAGNALYKMFTIMNRTAYKGLARTNPSRASINYEPIHPKQSKSKQV